MVSLEHPYRVLRCKKVTDSGVQSDGTLRDGEGQALRFRALGFVLIPSVLHAGSLYSRSPKVGNPIASILKSNV